MTLQDVRAALKDRNLAKVAEATGLSPATLYRISKGKAKPHKTTLRVLGEYLTKPAEAAE